MKSLNINYKSKNDLDEAKLTFGDKMPQHLLIQIFCGTPDKQHIAGLLSEVTSVFPGAVIIGTTTAGEIMDGKTLDNTSIVSITSFEKTRISTALITQNEDLYAAGEQLALTLNGAEVQLAIVFGCGIRNGGAVNGEPLLESLQLACPNTIIVGGQAGDNGLAKQTFVFSKDGITDSGVVAAFLEGNALKIDNRYNLSWVPLGKKMSITEAQNTQIKTIDNKPAKDVYAHYLGDNVGERLPHSAAEFPLVVERDGVLLARHANKVLEDGSLDFMAPFYEGEQVQFAFCHSGLVTDSAKNLYDEFCKDEHGAIFVYSCLSRKWVLGPDTHIEIAPLATLAPTSGFFSYGEYFSNNGKNMFLSQTMTILALSEETSVTSSKPDDKRSTFDFQENATKQVHDLQALHRLVETSADERESLIMALKRALAEIKTLQGFIPICAKCKNIRDDKGYWTKIEQYISERTEAQFSHSLCPGCVKDLYPDIYNALEEEGKIEKYDYKRN